MCGVVSWWSLIFFLAFHIHFTADGGHTLQSAFLPAYPRLPYCPLLSLRPGFHSGTADWKQTNTIKYWTCIILDSRCVWGLDLQKCVQTNCETIQIHPYDDLVVDRTLSAPADHRASPLPPSFSRCPLQCQQSNSSSVEGGKMRRQKTFKHYD